MPMQSGTSNAIVLHTNTNMDVVQVTTYVWSHFALATVDGEIFIVKMFS